MSVIILNKATVANHPRNRCASNTVTISIPFKTFLEWRGVEEDITYVELLNASIDRHVVQIKKPTSRIESILRKRMCMVENDYRKCSGGRQREELRNQEFKIIVHNTELVDVFEIESRAEKLYDELAFQKFQNTFLKDENSKLIQDLKDLEKVNSHLSEYVNSMPGITKLEFNYRKDDVGARQASRRFLKLEQNINQALWFLDAFDMKIDFVQVTDKTGAKLRLGDKAYMPKKRYDELDEDNKLKIQQILYILDKFCVGDNAYHELTILEKGLPRTCLIKQCRQSLNKLSHIERTPGVPEGVQMSFRSELVCVLSDIEDRKEKKNEDEPEKVVAYRVNLSGDGARISRLSNYTTLFFTVLKKESSDSETIHPLVIMKASESYSNLAESLADVLKEINEVISVGEITVNGKKVQLEFFLSGDYKFLLLVIMGQASATCLFACIWCLVHKSDRWRIREEWPERTLESISEHAEMSKDNYSVNETPLLNIPLTNVRIDELHLLLRIVEILLENLRSYALDVDKKSNFETGEAKDQTLQNFIFCVRQCGVTFDVWVRKDADSSSSGTYAHTALMGDEKKKVLTHLPSMFHLFIAPEFVDDLKNIWETFSQLYSVITNASPTDQDIIEFEEKSKSWVEQFVSLGGKLPGFEKSKVTPYMHILGAHIGTWLAHDRNIKQFTGQALEKKNDHIRRINQLKSNHHDSCYTIMSTCKRVERLQNKARVKRKYVRKSKEKVKRKSKHVGVELRQDTKERVQYEKGIKGLSAQDLKLRLKQKGVDTKLRSYKALVKLALKKHV